ncbi:outer membrane protein transport protein [Avibacterium avium]|uniref:Outer membrane protein n=1 Tax=Avibacterium avium TaxID=751 RepID=A0A379ASM3_AVIAV|nr:OmpP1/FadL family transporter [Avibacterium avium]SUB24281.1 outer membrane protein [Avibacterium avium]
MNKKTLFTKTLLSSALLAVAGGAQAAAFQLAEVSSSGLGRAYAGEAAIADNASVVATNPALMTLFKTNQFSAGGVYVDSKIRVDGTATATLNGQPVAKGNADNNNVVPGAFVPNLYYVAPINDKVALGAGMNVNFGLKSEYDRDYSAGIFGGTTDLTTINLNFSGAYRVAKGFSVGAGINAVYAKAEVERTAGIIADGLRNGAAAAQANATKLANTPYATQAATAAAQLSAASQGISSRETVLTHLEDRSAWGFGYNLGLVYEFNERNRLGLAYHSKVDIKFKDRNAVSYMPYGVMPYTGAGTLTLNLPGYWEISGFHQLTDAFAVHYSYKYTEWSRLKNLHATYESVPAGSRNGDLAFHKEERYRDNTRVALGASYLVNDQLTLRAGIAYDEAAAPTEHASASIPDTDRTWYSLGATYKFTPNLSVDFGFAHLRGKKVNFTETQSLGGGLVEVKADYRSKSSANLYGLNVNYSF